MLPSFENENCNVLIVLPARDIMREKVVSSMVNTLVLDKGLYDDEYFCAPCDFETLPDILQTIVRKCCKEVIFLTDYVGQLGPTIVKFCDQYFIEWSSYDYTTGTFSQN